MSGEREKNQAKHKPGSEWFGRSLDNYKNLHRGAAEARGNGKAFERATTVTEARKLAFGTKRGQSPIKKVG